MLYSDSIRATRYEQKKKLSPLSFLNTSINKSRIFTGHCLHLSKFFALLRSNYINNMNLIFLELERIYNIHLKFRTSLLSSESGCIFVMLLFRLNSYRLSFHGLKSLKNIFSIRKGKISV